LDEAQMAAMLFAVPPRGFSVMERASVGERRIV
jgi:hypothetical protein